ncbi:MAG TPA: polysaccharide deacetylase [Chloroflexi bacterium]|nr:polysaccharide deacetylase [Chloroflexota bacterium]
MINALSIDLEEWFHAELLRRHVSPEDRQFGQAAQAARQLLELLDDRNARATFFVVGELMAAEPALIQEIRAAGHEIGCHGLTHRPLWELDPASLTEELQGWRTLFRQVLNDVSPPVEGFRAPTFSLDRTTSWALPVLTEWGFRYDSSIFPRRNHVYGVRGAPTIPYRPAADNLVDHDPNGLIAEFPMSVTRVFGKRVPIAGGFYLRALPLGFVVHGFQQLNAACRPFNLYLHPWEIWTETPRVRGLSIADSLITYHNLGAPMLDKLKVLLTEFRFAPVSEVLARYGILPGTPPPASAAMPAQAELEWRAA